MTLRMTSLILKSEEHLIKLWTYQGRFVTVRRAIPAVPLLLSYLIELFK